MVDAARMPWYSMGSRINNEMDSSSSASLLHSIYGSQASQLTFSDHPSEYSLSGATNVYSLPGRGNSVTTLQRRSNSRPKSSPVHAITAREQQRKALTCGWTVQQAPVVQQDCSVTQEEREHPIRVCVRPTSAVFHQSEPSQAQRKLSSTAFQQRTSGSKQIRPSSAAYQQRPSGLSQVRPSSAAYQQRPSGLSQVRPSSSAYQQRPSGLSQMRPSSAAYQQSSSQVRPSSAAFQQRPSQVRPSSVVSQQRPSQKRPSSAETVSRLRASASRQRPKTAVGMLLDLEEETDSEEQIPHTTKQRPHTAIARTTTPVRVTRTPEYFNFWLGKPLQERDYGVKMQKRKHWKRPRSDYGNRFGGRRQSNGSENNDGGRGTGAGTELETLIETDDSEIGKEGQYISQEGEGGKGEDSDGKHGLDGDGEDDLCKEEGGGGDDSGGGGDDSGGGGNGDTINGNKSHKLKQKEDERAIRDTTRKKVYIEMENLSKDTGRAEEKVAWETVDGTSDADKDDYFTRSAFVAISWLDSNHSSKKTRFELPMDLITLSTMTPLQYLRKHCIISDRRMAHYSELFTKCDRDKDLRLNIEEVKAGLIKAHHFPISMDQVLSILDLVQFPGSMQVDIQLFAALCCLAERLFGVFYLELTRKEIIETVDFEGLDWKLKDCSISQSLHRLFLQLIELK